MIDDTKGGRMVDRRGFLKGSALFAAVLGAAAVPALAQEPKQPSPAEKPADKPADKATSAAAKKAPATSARVTRARAAKPTDPTAVPAKKN